MAPSVAGSVAVLLVVSVAVQGAQEALECRVDANCSSIPLSTCQKDLTDSKMRCLCPDKKIPVGGKCAPVTTVPKPLECSVDANCTSIPFSECLRDPTDSKLRCLCASPERKAPVDGKCPSVGTPQTSGAHSVLALYTECKEETDCPSNAECDFPKGLTNVSEPHDKKVCQCKAGFQPFNSNSSCVTQGKACSSDSDCTSFTNTSCVEDRLDHQQRCLCGNGNAPGVTSSCPKAAIMAPCKSWEDCPVNALCSNSADGKDKVCTCDKDFKSKDNILCEPNSVGRAAILSLSAILMFVSLTIVF